VLVPAAHARAQGSEEPWGPGTTLSVFGGAGSSDSRIAGVAGASIGWELKPYLAFEGSGAWIARTADSRAFAALLGPRVSLRGPGAVVPSVSLGVGMMRASVNLADARVPPFYARRAGVLSGRTTAVFEDFALAVGGGADVFLGHHLAIRPDVRVLFVTADSEIQTVPIFGVHMTYHFEAHPYLPRRR
jgi:hypothetical protein